MEKQQTQLEFTGYYHRFKQVVYNYALKMSGNRMVTDDIVQAVFLKLFEHLPAIRNKESISFWLFKSTRNEIFAYFRRKKIDAGSSSVDDMDSELTGDSGNIAMHYELTNLREIVRDELHKLPVEQRDVLLLREYGGFSYREIGEMLQIDEELVKSRIFKGRAKLAKRLQPIIEQ